MHPPSARIERGPPLACPRCARALDAREDDTLACPSCGPLARRDGSIADFLHESMPGGRAGGVRAFYERNPFPGYAPGDDAAQIVDRGRRSPFLAALDASLAPDATVLDLGCGTAQVAAFLALSARGRTVVALDGCRASLRAADRFRTRERVDGLALVRADLFQPPLARGSFQLVLCRGVVHHTEDPCGAIRAVAARVAPGGHLVLGFYEPCARGLHVARQVLYKLGGRRAVAPFDPILRRHDLDPEKKRIWIEDQYRHPLEALLGCGRVTRFLEREGFAWVRSVPPACEPGQDLLDPTPRPGRVAELVRGLAWLARGLGDEDAGLVCVVMRRLHG